MSVNLTDLVNQIKEMHGKDAASVEALLKQARIQLKPGKSDGPRGPKRDGRPYLAGTVLARFELDRSKKKEMVEALSALTNGKEGDAESNNGYWLGNGWQIVQGYLEETAKMEAAKAEVQAEIKEAAKNVTATVTKEAAKPENPSKEVKGK